MSPDMMRFGRRAFAVVLIVVLVVAVISAAQILLLVFAGILLAIFLRTLGSWLHARTRLSMNWCMLIVLLGFGTFLFGSMGIFGLQIANQADELFRAVSDAYRDFRQKVAQYPIAAGLSSDALNLETQATAAASGVLWTVASVVMVLFIGVYLSTKPQLYIELFLSFFDRPMHRRLERLLDAMGSALRWWLAGQFIAMALVGVITTVGLVIIGTPMAISLGVLAGLLTFIPYIGAIISAVPAVLIALTQSNEMAMYVMLVYLVAHIVEGYIVVPLIQQKLVYLPPALILAMQFLMELFVGVVGVTFGTPLMVVGMVLIKKLYFKQEWDEPVEESSAPAA